MSSVYEGTYTTMLSPPYTPPHSPKMIVEGGHCYPLSGGPPSPQRANSMHHTDLDAVETLLSISRGSHYVEKRNSASSKVPMSPSPRPLTPPSSVASSRTATSDSEYEDSSPTETAPAPKRPRHDSELARLLLSSSASSPSPPRTPSPVLTSMPVSVIVRASSFSSSSTTITRPPPQQRTFTPPPQPTYALSRTSSSTKDKEDVVCPIVRNIIHSPNMVTTIRPLERCQTTAPSTVITSRVAASPPQQPPTTTASQVIPLLPLTVTAPLSPILNGSGSEQKPIGQTMFVTPMQTQTLFPLTSTGQGPIMHFVLTTTAAACPTTSDCGNNNINKEHGSHPRFRPLFPAPIVLPATTATSATCSPTLNSRETNQKAKDTRRRLYQCEYENCDKKYFKSSHLKAHIRIHTGEKPFVCTWDKCGRCFSRSDELSRHKRTHTGEKRFVCPNCGHRFMRSDHLTKHIKRHVTSKKSFSWQTTEGSGGVTPPVSVDNTQISSGGQQQGHGLGFCLMPTTIRT